MCSALGFRSNCDVSDYGYKAWYEDWTWWVAIFFIGATLFGVVTSLGEDDAPRKPGVVYEVCDDYGRGGSDCYDVRVSP